MSRMTRRYIIEARWLSVIYDKASVDSNTAILSSYRRLSYIWKHSISVEHERAVGKPCSGKLPCIAARW